MHSKPLPNEGVLGQELGQTLRRVEAPAGFADAVLRRLDEEQAGRLVAAEGVSQGKHQISQAAGPSSPSPSRKLFRFPAAARFAPVGLVAALLLILLLPLTGYLHSVHQQARAEAAAQQFALAMRLTHAALLDAGEHMAERAHARNGD